MQTRLPRVAATVSVAASAGAQVAAGMVGDHAWQLAFLVLTVLTAAGGGWLTTGGGKRKTHSPSSNQKKLRILFNNPARLRNATG